MNISSTSSTPYTRLSEKSHLLGFNLFELEDARRNDSQRFLVPTRRFTSPDVATHVFCSLDSQYRRSRKDKDMTLPFSRNCLTDNTAEREDQEWLQTRNGYKTGMMRTAAAQQVRARLLTKSWPNPFLERPPHNNVMVSRAFVTLSNSDRYRKGFNTSEEQPLLSQCRERLSRPLHLCISLKGRAFFKKDTGAWRVRKRSRRCAAGLWEMTTSVIQQKGLPKD